MTCFENFTFLCGLFTTFSFVLSLKFLSPRFTSYSSKHLLSNFLPVFNHCKYRVLYMLMRLYLKPPFFHHFNRFLNTLALSIPQKASFFITYIMVDGWSGPAGEILRFWPLVLYHIKNSFLVKTERDRLQATSPGTIELNRTLPQLELYFLMGLVYSVITPIIIPFIIVFLAFGFVVCRYQVGCPLCHRFPLSIVQLYCFNDRVELMEHKNIFLDLCERMQFSIFVWSYMQS